MITIVLPEERPQSWNKFYSGKHWSKRVEEADRVHELIKYSTLKLEKTLFEVPVDIIITAYFKKNPLDSDNIMAKLYVDGLKGIFLIDDSLKYVDSVKTRSRIDRINPRLEIEIIPLE